MNDPLAPPDDEEIDKMIDDAAEKRKTRTNDQPSGNAPDNPDGRPYADYTPCPICGTEVLQLPGHLPCDDE